MDRHDNEDHVLTGAEVVGIARVPEKNQAQPAAPWRATKRFRRRTTTSVGRYVCGQSTVNVHSFLANWKSAALLGNAMSYTKHHTDTDAERRRKDRVLRARVAAAERWGHTGDWSAATAPARQGLRAKFEQQADPDGVLPLDERARRADALQRAHMLRLSQASARARRRRT
jgi:hypothetical protein